MRARRVPETVAVVIDGNPEFLDEAAFEPLAAEVRNQNADLGIALDGDADRLQMVDASGRLFNGDELLYLMAADRMARNSDR